MKRREFITLLGGAVALTWPRAVNAEKAGSSSRISFLALVPEEDKTLMSALLERLHELGYREDTNMVFQYRSAEGRPERLAPLALEFVRDKPDVLVAGFGTLAAKAAKEATATIPVVFTTTRWVQVSSRASPGPAEMSPASPTRHETFKASVCNFFWNSSQANRTSRRS